MPPRDTELSLKLSPKNAQLLRRASAMAGFESLSEFVLQVTLERASRILESAETITLDSESFDAFIADCEQPGPPNSDLKKANERRRVEKAKSS
ncbi:DUF1778 domain-containing protein [Marinobacter salsuginis]|uniref:DUF1778 domain-containing protein n=1 Tax=Marinobacter salsuginis TaxID=418719 RepID=A0A5M3PTJ4_9GAMM|nr:DUF1778 domain-containing protein [Marinobacter salsuginis]GBO86240.1 hypothetical protein MS5N3_36910 [Marinobacter salsuginis]